MTWAKRRAIVIIILVVFFVVLVMVASKPGELRLPSRGVLVIDLMGQIDEQRSPDIFSAFSGNSSSGAAQLRGCHRFCGERFADYRPGGADCANGNGLGQTRRDSRAPAALPQERQDQHLLPGL